MAEISVCSFDPSLRNWGVARGFLDLDTLKVTIMDLDVIRPTLPTGKQVRANSKDVESAYQLFDGARKAAEGAQVIFAEVPEGSQSSRAMASYGICVGVLGSIRGMGSPFFPVTPTEVKKASAGSRTASKNDMIRWAMEQHPEAPWPMQKKNGEMVVIAGQAEHMADAIAAIYAGLDSLDFQRMIAFLKAA